MRTLSALVLTIAIAASAPAQALGILQPGMVVKDRHGERVAIILRTDQIKDGKPAFLLDDNGAQFKVEASKFTLNRKGNEAIIALTRSQIRTAAILNTP